MSEEMKITAPEEQFEDVKGPETTVENQSMEPAQETQDLQDVPDVTDVQESQVETIPDDIPEASKDEVQEMHNTAEVDYTQMSLKDIVQSFSDLIERGDQQEMYRLAERIKAAFYVTLKKEKIAVGYIAPAGIEGEQAEETVTEAVSNNPFAEIERVFKDLYSQYRNSRTQYIQIQEKNKEENLKIKLAIIEEIKDLLDKQEDINKTFPAFRDIQNRWRESGPVPQNRVKDLYETYQHYVEMFYDLVKINNELRDLDFKKNLEAKVVLCEKAEALKDFPDAIAAFNQLQKLHEEWKEFGPVEKDKREEVWNRFKEATSYINRRYQGHFEDLKVVQKRNYEAKVALCEKVEEIAEREVSDAMEWNKGSKEIEEIQKEWKKIGFAARKDNQKIYDRFRAACDKFFDKKRQFYAGFKDQMTENYEKKVALCEQAEALKDNTEWKKTTDKLIALQKEWKEIGPVPRKKSEPIWKRFRAACDEFFNRKDKMAGNSDETFAENLKNKRTLIEEIKSFNSTGSQEEDLRVMNDFQAQWESIGFVPAKDKEDVIESYREVMLEKFTDFKDNLRENKPSPRRKPNKGGGNYRGGRDNGPRSERDRLILKYKKNEADIATWENNMGFFAKSKNAEILLEELSRKIEVAKEELLQLEEKIKNFDNQE